MAGLQFEDFIYITHKNKRKTYMFYFDARVGVSLSLPGFVVLP